MATANPFDLLGDSENDDLSLLIAAQKKKPLPPATSATSTPTPAKLPSKPLPPAQAVRDARNNGALMREGVGRGGSGRGRGGRGGGNGTNRDFENGSYSRYGGGRGGFSVENGDVGDLSERGRGGSAQYRGSSRGGRRGGYGSGSGEGGIDSDRSQRRFYERRSGTGMGSEMKKDGSGRGNWGTFTDDVHAQGAEESGIVDVKVETGEKQVEQIDGSAADASKDSKKEEAAHEGEKEQEDNEMTLEEYEKIREEKRKALLSLKVEERKVEIDKELQSMQQLTLKKSNDDVFIKLSSDKDSPKLRDIAEKEERIKKVVNINEFLKPAEGGRYYSPSGRGRGRGRGGGGGGGGGGGDREFFRSSYTGGSSIPPVIPSIEDQGQFPALGAKGC